jgi:hypothetical protein
MEEINSGMVSTAVNAKRRNRERTGIHLPLFLRLISLYTFHRTPV